MKHQDLELLTKKQAAEEIGCSLGRLEKMIRSGLRVFEVDGIIGIQRSEIERFYKANTHVKSSCK